MDHRNRAYQYAAIIAALLFSCAKDPNPDERLLNALIPVRERYAPDRRVAIFTVTPEWQNGVLVAKGEVDNPQAKTDALGALKDAANVDPVDSIIVLPDPRLGENRNGIITVSVGNVRSRPGQDEELGTQVLMGMVVKLLKKRGGWYYVQSNDKYLGWIEDDAMVVTDDKGVDDWIAASKVITVDYFGVVREKPSLTAQPVSDVVAGAMLKKGGEGGSWIAVALPDGRKGYIGRSIVQDYGAWRKSRRLTTANIENTAKMFVGVPYLWGGTSAKGFDCSGYTKTVYRLNGLELNRDANQQSLMGEDVAVGGSFQGLKDGDLLFFGRKAAGEKPERIWHVGIYLGNKEFIHCAGRVRINSFDSTASHFDRERLNTFVRARRLIGMSQVPEVG